MDIKRKYELYKKLIFIILVSLSAMLFLMIIITPLSGLLEYFFDTKNIEGKIFLPAFLSFIFLAIILIPVADKYYKISTDITNKKTLSKIYGSFTSQNIKYTNIHNNNKNFNNPYHVKFPTSVNKQQEIEDEIKKIDSNFNKIIFKQKAMSRFNFLQNCLNNKKFDELIPLESKELYSSQKNNSNNIKTINNYKIKYSFIDNYEIKDNKELLSCYITIKNYNDEILTYVMTFSRIIGTVTKNETNKHVNNCPHCGGIISDDLFTCKYCGKKIIDNFEWIITNLEIYN